MRWWDQGRLDYFQFDNIHRISQALSTLDGVIIEGHVDNLRPVLTSVTGLPFSPKSIGYPVWRNYARVFGTQLLAAKIGNRLACTELCHRLATLTDPISGSDDYFSHIFRRSYAPSPTAEKYSATAAQVFPFCAILKFLVARKLAGITSGISVPDFFEYLVANGLTGREDIKKYVGLRKVRISIAAEEKRQVREMMIFMSQLSILKWNAPNLYLDISDLSDAALRGLEVLYSPIEIKRLANKKAELVAMGSVFGSGPDLTGVGLRDDLDAGFVEGKRVRRSHLAIERSGMLRVAFFAQRKPPYLCDLCELDGAKKYPWLENILELHHLLPLSSPVRMDKTRTFIGDMAPLCPSCHRAVHSYYRKWLKGSAKDDFSGNIEAKAVYAEAKKKVA